MSDHKRVNFRPDPRPEPDTLNDSRARAEARSKQLMEHANGDMDDGVDKFFVDRRAIPDAWEYEWKRRTVYNQEDPAYQTQLAQKGWDPVPRSRHPEMMPVGWSGDTIERDGMVLMERPKQISDMARDADLRRAKQQVRVKEQQLTQAPSGQFDRDNKGSPLATIKKSFEAMPIPE